jgi:archaellum biogenesis ATPase FlaH
MNSLATPARSALESIRNALEVVCEPRSVVEVRILHTRKKTVAGWFNDFNILANAVAAWDGKAPAIYATLNPVHADLLYRAVNRLQEYANDLTQDPHILRRRWLPLDFDPVRFCTGISSTDAQHAAALTRAQLVCAWLTEQGWPAPVVADSGNGGHLLYRVDLLNDDDSRDVIRRCVEAVALRFSDAALDVDETVFNAARIWKVYGTLACKGDNTPERPHRRAALLDVPAPLTVVSRALLEKVAALAPAQPPSVAVVSGDRLDVEAWVVKHGLAVVHRGAWNGGRKWILNPCPWNPDHTNRAAYIVQLASGGIAAGCQHNGCHGKGWHDLRDLVEPRWREARAPIPNRDATKGKRVTPAATVDTRPFLVPARDLKAAPVSFAVHSLIPMAMLSLLSGRDKRGKTLLAQEIVRAVLKGTPFLDRFPTHPGTVIGAFLDDPASLTLERLTGLGVREHPNLYLVDPLVFDGDAERFLDRLEEEAAKLRPVLVVVDSFYQLVPSGRDAGNDQARMGPVMGRFNQLAESSGAAMLLVAHDNKSGQDVAGSHVIRAAAKSIMRVKLPRGAEPEDPDDAPATPRRILTVETKFGAATSWALEVRGVGAWRCFGSSQDLRASDTLSAVRVFLKDGGTGTAEEIAERVGRRREDVEEALRILQGTGEAASNTPKSGRKGRPKTVYTAADGRADYSSREFSGGGAQDGNSEAQLTIPPGLSVTGDFSSPNRLPKKESRDENSVELVEVTDLWQTAQP